MIAPVKRAQARFSASHLLAPGARAKLSARYDAAQTTREFERWWANADGLDADSANTRTVREALVRRSRYEIQNNGFSDGIAQTYATDLIGKGPRLRMLTASEGFNRLVESTWAAWSRAVQFRRKLWCLAHAKLSDGEGFGVIKRNPRIGPVPIDWHLIETEQVQTPALPFEIQPGYIDGVRFDEFGNVMWYDVLEVHPGSTQPMAGYNQIPQRVPAEMVTHWFLMRRPGQHRGIPELASTLNAGAAARRWREATLGAAETAAEFSVLLRTNFTPDELESVEPMSTMDIEKRMMTALPEGYDAFQMRAEHPNSTYESFHKALVNEQARPKSMPLNKAMTDSSSYNFASGRLDHQTYYGAIDVDRDDCIELVLEPLFTQWLRAAVNELGWLGGDAFAIQGRTVSAHTWDWPRHPVADQKSEAQANETRLRSGQTTLDMLYAENGNDFETVVQRTAEAFGKSEDEVREAYWSLMFAGVPGAPGQPAGQAMPQPADEGEDDEADED